MKHFVTLLFAMIVLSSLNVTAQTNYNLKVNGITVTSDNAAAITGDGITGTVKYDAASNVLTLDNATIAATGGNNAIMSKTDGLTIELVGTNSLSSTSASTVCLFNEATITGKGSVSVECGNSTAIQVMECPLTIKGGCKVEASGIGGIADLMATEWITVNASTVKASGFVFGAISDCFVKLVDCDITSGGYSEDEVVIEPVTTGISTVTKLQPADTDTVYTTGGVRLGRVPAKGLYIKGGKKVVAGQR